MADVQQSEALVFEANIKSGTESEKLLTSTMRQTTYSFYSQQELKRENVEWGGRLG